MTEQMVLLAARRRGASRPVHAIEALVAPGEDTIADDRTVCNRLATGETDLAVADFMEVWLAVPTEDRCASCAYFAQARDAGMAPVVRVFDGSSRWSRPD